MDIALLTEGTYPYHFGGVSVWCDQLVRGMPEHNFHLVALVAGNVADLAWELPGNISSVTAVPLWGAAYATHRSSRAEQRRCQPLMQDFLRALLDPTEQGQQRFEVVLRQLFEYGRQADLAAVLSSEYTVQTLSEAWQDGWLDGENTAPTVFDAVTAMELIAHSLRPLTTTPPQVDVSHCVANGLAVLPALAAKWTYGTPILLTEHGIYLRERYLGYQDSPYRWPVKALHLAFLRKLCTLAYRESHMIAPGNVYNKRWEEKLGANPAMIRTIYNGVDPADFPSVDAEPEAPTVSWAGRIDPIKDIETLLHSFALVHKQLPDARLRIFGGVARGAETYLATCRELAISLGIGEVTTFEGRVPQIRDAYAAGHVVVLSSISEGFPYTVIEAMTCGKACVATDVGGVTEAVGDTGLIVPPRDPASMANACLSLLRDSRLRNELGGKARRRALEHFTVDRAVGTFDEVYTSLVSRASGLAANISFGSNREARIA